MRKHSGYATQARRRGEDMVLCNSCGRHPRGYAPPEPETPADFWRAFATFAFLIVALYALVIVLAGMAVQP